MVNPWRGVEATWTHALSSIFDVPTAHAAMFESRDIENLETGIVEPRMSAEAVRSKIGSHVNHLRPITRSYI